MQYTENQIKAIEHNESNLQIIACAGSGKTQVIAKRIIHILKTKQDIKPGNIVAFTYTEKASVELKNRILKLARVENLPSLGMAEMYVGTIHSWCLRILQDSILKYQKYNVLDEIKLKLFIDRFYSESGMKELGLKIYTDTGIFIQLMTILRESELNVNAEIPEKMALSQKMYESLLDKYCYFDFTQILSKLSELLKTDAELKCKISERIKYLVVDEYQDVNPVQEKLIESLHSLGANLCVVGDDDQTIYQWRGSDVRNILEFSNKYKPVKVIKLEENHRSSDAVVATALRTIKNNIIRKEKEMVSSRKQKYERGDILYNAFENPELENTFIVKQIQELRGVSFTEKDKTRGIDFGDFCVLVRTWSKAQSIKDSFENAGIPFIVTGVSQLFQTREVKAAKNIFLYLAGQIDLEVLKDSWEASGSKIDIELFEKAVVELQKKKPEKINFYDDFCIQKIYQEFLEDVNITEESFKSENVSSGYNRSEIVFYNLGQFSHVIDDFETIYYNTKPTNKLNNFLNFLNYAAEDYYPEGWLSNSFKTPNAVQIMTIHQSKGLEFPVIFIPGLNKNYLPAKGIGGASVWSKFKEEIPQIIQGYERYKGGVEDERRLFYVAITRAKKFLFITRAPIPDNRLYQKESDFVKEISHSDYIFSDKNRSYNERSKEEPRFLREEANIFLNFSVLKNFFECPYRFKLSTMYGFHQPLNMRIGFGRAIHNALMEMHQHVLHKQAVTPEIIPKLLDTHFYLPYAKPDGVVYSDMKQNAEHSLLEYYKENANTFENIEFAEKDIEINLGDGVLVNGRIDLVKKKLLDGTVETTIIDFKSVKDAQTFDISKEQLMLYALGYQELTGQSADFFSIYNLDENKPHKEEIKKEYLVSTKTAILQAADDIRGNQFPLKPEKNKCETCKMNKICSKKG
jgi:DNA helicase II / ATP-dependent DNA helicase PcrA